MSSQPRVVKVLSALVVSMTTGALVLIALGNNAPSAGTFSLSNTLVNLNVVEKVISSAAPQVRGRWKYIEVSYSGTKAGNIEQLASLEGLGRSEDVNFHFCLCNGLGGPDGRIEPTEKWRRQWSCISGPTWYGTDQTIRICVVSDGMFTRPTDYQRKSTSVLVDSLMQKFSIEANCVYFPSNWQ
jgi:hypothetical protein